MDSPAARGPWFWISVFFGSGLAPVAPGTFGSIAAMALWGPLVWFSPHWGLILLASLLVFLLGIPASAAGARAFGTDDPGHVVIDEVAGLGLALVVAQPVWWHLVLGFALFRFFDIVKPWPVAWADRRVHGGLGIMLDDMIAGAYAAGFLWAAMRAASAFGWS